MQARGARFTLLPLRVSSLTHVTTRPEKNAKRKQHLFCMYFFFFDLTAADIRVSSQGTKNLAFSNDLLIFPEEQADMHVSMQLNRYRRNGVYKMLKWLVRL